MKHSKNGFTLIEIMEVVFVLAILAIAGATSYQRLLSNSRDQTKLRDLNSIKQALELYHDQNHFYPTYITLNTSRIAEGTTLTSSSGNPKSVSQSTTFMDVVPTDRASGYWYSYQGFATSSGGSCDNASGATSCQYYILCAKGENSSSTNKCPIPSGVTFNCKAGLPCDLGVTPF